MKNYKFLLVNISGDFLSIAQRLEEEGYETFSFYSKDSLKGKGAAGKHMINIVPDMFDVINQFKDKKDELIILIDDNSWGDMMDYLKSEGWLVIGSSALADKAEHSREFGSKIAKKIGLKTPPTWEFSDFKEAQAFIEHFGKQYPDARFVFKGDGVDLAGTSKTYLSKSIEDMTWFLDWVEKDQQVHAYLVEKFILQLAIEGIEADFSSWFSGTEFINNTAITFEEKKHDGLGAAVGCLGQIVTFEPAAKSKFFREYLSKLTPMLSKGKEVNEWAANTIISQQNNLPYFLEWTPRFGWDSTFGELSILKDKGRKIGEFFINLVTGGKFPAGFFPTGVYSCSVRIFSESFGTKGEDVNGKPIDWDKRIKNNIWFYSIRERDDGRSEITDNPIGVVTATAEAPEEAMAKCYRIIEPENQLISSPDLYYFRGIGDSTTEKLRQIQKMGWW